jgi:hypothetical protein
MPIKSEAQQRAMYASASGKGKSNIPKKTAKKYIESTPKSAYKNMPPRKRKMAGKRKSY